MSKARSLLEKEETDLKEARYVQDALKKRLEELQLDWDGKSSKSAEELSKELLDEQHKRKIAYEKDTKFLIRAFNKFINDHLAGQLAAEDLGGPVVGDSWDINDKALEVGFKNQGKAKKYESTEVSDAKRQRRKAEIWGSNGQEIQDESERELAGSEFRSLTEELLNAAAEGENPYVELRRESAGARFLVRSKVATFRPEDASQLRLVDFAAEFD